MSTYFLLIFLLNFIKNDCECAKILSIGFAGFKSHKIAYEPLLFELDARGHNVTVLAQSSIENKGNIRVEFLNGEEEYLKRINLPSVFESNTNGGKVNYADTMDLLCEEFYDTHIVKQIIHEKFDLVIIDGISPECVAGVIHKLNTLFIFVTSYAVPNFRALKLGSPSPPSFIQAPYTDYPLKMNFQQRLTNFLYAVATHAFFEFSFAPKMEEIYRRKLNDSTIPGSSEILGRVSLLLSCSHFSIGQPIPFLPDIIEVGGIHLGPPKPLPEDLAAFLGQDDFIYFSFGSLIKGVDMPEKQKRIFVQVFSQLKLKVLWKLETENSTGIMEDYPPNVMLANWFPQQDVLGQANCKLFITHGGYGSVAEAVYHGVPMIGMPFWWDQPQNLRRAEERGYAIILNFSEISEDELLHAIDQMLSGRFRENVQLASSIFKDQLDNPLDRAIFWIEYVIRHKGASHLRSAARDLNFVQYYSLDAVVFLFVVFIGILAIGYTICRIIVVKILLTFKRFNYKRNKIE